MRLLEWIKASRKAIAAFLLPIITLPIAEWIAGTEPFDTQTVVSAIVAGFIAAIGVWTIPNAINPPAGP